MKRRFGLRALAFILGSLMATTAIGFSAYSVGTSKVTKSVSVSKDTTSKAVCYNSNTNIYYTTIEKALNVAKSNEIADTIYVIPGTRATITNCEIAAADTLCLPFEGTTYDKTLGDAKKDGDYLRNKPFACSDPDTYLKTKITIANGNVLTNYGKIQIGGSRGGSNGGGKKPSGHTAGSYCEISLGEESKIINAKGSTLECNGYITETTTKNGSIVDNFGTTYCPFVIYDFNGGTYTTMATGANIMPFYLFDFPNIRTTFRAEKEDGSKMIGKFILGSVLEKGSESNVYSCSSDDGSIFLLTAGYFDFYYNTINSDNYGKMGKTDITIYGSLTIGSSSISMAGYSLDLSRILLPLSYKFNIDIISGTTTINTNVKFLPGSKVMVGNNGTLIFNYPCIFMKNFQYATSVPCGSDYYPSEYANAESELVSEGMVKINSSFGGKIFTTENYKSGKIITGDNFIDNCTSNEISSYSSSKVTVGTVHKIYAICNINAKLDEGYLKVSQTYSDAGQYYNSGSFGSSASGTSGASFGTNYTCLLFKARVLMADGSYKEAGQIRTGDIVMSMNHETGQVEPTKVIGNDDISRPAQEYNAIHLSFANGKSTDFIYEHGYFDKGLNKYVYLHESDCKNYVGDSFAFYENGKLSFSELVSADIREEYTTLASPCTANGLNLIVDDMLSMAGGLSGLFNIFDYDPNTLAFDDIKKREDIDRYGLLGYDAFEKYFPEEIYNLLPCKYLNVSIGKGLITWDIFEGYVAKWKDQLMENL